MKSAIGKKLVVILVFVIALFAVFALLYVQVVDYWTPKSYTLSGVTGDNVSLVEKEFLFRLPENSVIDHVSVIKARESTSICHIKGSFTPEEFLSQYADFSVEKKSDSSTELLTYSIISGFSDYRASVSFEVNETTTTVTITKRGSIADRLLKNAEVHKGQENLIF